MLSSNCTAFLGFFLCLHFCHFICSSQPVLEVSQAGDVKLIGLNLINFKSGILLLFGASISPPAHAEVTSQILNTGRGQAVCEGCPESTLIRWMLGQSIQAQWSGPALSHDSPNKLCVPMVTPGVHQPHFPFLGII